MATLRAPITRWSLRRLLPILLAMAISGVSCKIVGTPGGVRPPPVPPTDGLAIMLQPAHSRPVFSMPVLRSEGSALSPASRIARLDPRIRVEIRATDFKSPCVRLESEIVPHGGHAMRPVVMIANQVVLKVHHQPDQNAVQEMLNTLHRGGVIAERLPLPDTYLVEFRQITCAPGPATVLALPAVLTLLRGIPMVDFAEPNFLYFKNSMPNDTRLGELWGIHNDGFNGGQARADIHAFEGWEFVHDAADKIVAVVDSGIRGAHPDLVDNLWTNPIEAKGTAGSDDDVNGYDDDVHGWDFYNNDADPDDDDTHGTHVAGTIGARGDNKMGVVGVAWRIQMMALKFMENWGGSEADASKAIAYATKMHANIISASWGSAGSDSTDLKNAIDEAGKNHVLVVIAAGNDFENTGSRDNDAVPYYPASYESDNIIAVAATNSYDVIAPFSHYGWKSVDLAAPGVDILSTVTDIDYVPMTGTSQATPLVAGACALAWAQDPAASYATIKQRVLDSVDPLDSLKGKCVSGGRLNLERLLQGGRR